MQGRRNNLKPDFKVKVALEALKGDKSTAELAQIYDVHPTQICQWKKQLLDAASTVLETKDSVGCSRSPVRSIYYKGKHNESQERLDLMEDINQIYLAHLENGSRMMMRVPRRMSRTVNRKRIQRLMQSMGIASLAHSHRPRSPIQLTLKSLPAKEAADQSPRPSVVRRHYLDLLQEGLLVFDCHHGLALAQSVLVAGL